jgi:quinol monooxygenase YgiN
MTPAATLFVFVRLHASTGNEANVLDALRAVVRASRTEPGCVSIDAFRGCRDEALFFIHSVWRDASAFDHHAELPHTKQFMDRVDRLLDEPRQVMRTSRLD